MTRDRRNDLPVPDWDPRTLCANCGEYKQYHDDGTATCRDFEVEDTDRTCCDTLVGEPHRSDCAKAARD